MLFCNLSSALAIPLHFPFFSAPSFTAVMRCWLCSFAAPPPSFLQYTQYTQYTTTENRRRGRRRNPPGMVAGGGGGGEMRMEGNDPYYRARGGESRDPRKEKGKKHSPLPKRKKSPQYIHMYVCVHACRHARDITIRSLPSFPRPPALFISPCLLRLCKYTHVQL